MAAKSSECEWISEKKKTIHVLGSMHTYSVPLLKGLRTSYHTSYLNTLILVLSLNKSQCLYSSI